MTSTLRCFRVFELLAEEPFELSVSDISDALSLPRATSHRLCATLMEAGFVERAPASKRYRLTPKPLWVGSGYLRHSAVYRAAFFPLQTLVKQVVAPAQLGIPFEGEVLFIHSLGGERTTDRFADVGLRRALHATASGKLFLAAMPLDRVKQLMSRGVAKYTEHTTVSFDRMEEDLKQIAVKGYAVNDEELFPGYVALAAPVYDATRHTVAAISITLPADRAHADDGTQFVAPLREAARQTSLLLGFNQSSRPSPANRSRHLTR